MSGYVVVALALAMFSLGVIAGHGLGYWRAKDYARRVVEAMNARQRRAAESNYRRVGRPE